VYGPGPGYAPHAEITPLLAKGGPGNEGAGVVGVLPHALVATARARRHSGPKPTSPHAGNPRNHDRMVDTTA